MRLYRISQHTNNGYDTYDAAIVAAETPDAARYIYPSEYKKEWDGKAGPYSDWANVEDVEVEDIGEANADVPSGIVLASFNAG